MAHQLTPQPGREDEGHPRLQSGSRSALTGCFDADLHLPGDLGVGPRESDSGRMLGWVLVVVAVTMVAMLLALVWWLV